MINKKIEKAFKEWRRATQKLNYLKQDQEEKRQAFIKTLLEESCDELIFPPYRFVRTAKAILKNKPSQEEVSTLLNNYPDLVKKVPDWNAIASKAAQGVLPYPVVQEEDYEIIYNSARNRYKKIIISS